MLVLPLKDMYEACYQVDQSQLLCSVSLRRVGACPAAGYSMRQLHTYSPDLTQKYKLAFSTGGCVHALQSLLVFGVFLSAVKVKPILAFSHPHPIQTWTDSNIPTLLSISYLETLQLQNVVDTYFTFPRSSVFHADAETLQLTAIRNSDLSTETHIEWNSICMPRDVML